MAEISSLKRQRGEIQVVEEEEDLFKRPKSSYKDIITLLEEEEDVPNEDLTSLISTLQQEICSSASPSSSRPDPNHDSALSGPYQADSEGQSSGSGEDETESVMRHLLEASDDELGLPTNNITDRIDEVVGGQVDGGDLLLAVGGEGLWEFEDYEAANYCSLLQFSEIFV